MAKARKEGKPKRNSVNLAQRLKRIARNVMLLKQFEYEK